MRLAFSLLLSTCLLSSAALADDGDAKQLFDEAKELMLAGDFERACPKLEESQLLAPRTGTLINLAACHERLGKIATAWVEYQKAGEMAREARERERERLANERIEVLAPRVPWVTVNVAPDPPVGLAIGIDGVPVDPERWGASLPVDPGEHVLVAAAPGYVPIEQRFSIVESQTRAVVVPKLAPVAAPAPKVAPKPKHRKPKKPQKPSKPAAAKPPPEADDKGRSWVLEVGLFGGYLLLDPDYTAIAEDPQLTQMGAPVTCDAINCQFNIGTPLSGAALGVSLFAGYQVSKDFHLGGRILVGPRIGGGLFGGLGPSALLKVGGPVWLGFGGMIGGGNFVSPGQLSAPMADTNPGTVEIQGTVGIALGPMLELEVHVAETEQGVVALTATPVFLLGTEGGTLFSVPLGAGFRFQ